MEMTSQSHFLTQTIYSDSLKEPNPSNLWLTFWFSCLIDFISLFGWNDRIFFNFAAAIPVSSTRVHYIHKWTINQIHLQSLILSWPTVLFLLFVGHFSSNGGLQIFFPHRNLLFILMFILGSYVDFIFL